MDTSKVVTIPEPRLERAGPDLWRIVATVEGTDVFFESHVPLSPRPEVRDSLGTTVRACGLEFIVVRTNIRAHPLFRAVKWGIVHVSALAAVAHALGPRVHKMYVAASDVPPPSGSAPDLDAPRSSEAVSLENYSAELTRLQRVESIAQWELLRGASGSASFTTRRSSTADPARSVSARKCSSTSRALRMAWTLSPESCLCGRRSAASTRCRTRCTISGARSPHACATAGCATRSSGCFKGAGDLFGAEGFATSGESLPAGSATLSPARCGARVQG